MDQRTHAGPHDLTRAPAADMHVERVRVRLLGAKPPTARLVEE
ncbi:hypothetical protein [Streptomyces abikoensis]|uniref:Uncharacterized protein n=1 Tax=Streptomyces abikoensis TaxID=97398 RepID=A0ABW7TFW7_9ACTN